MNESITDIEERLDRSHIKAAAAYAVAAMTPSGSARVDLTPGDMTRYPLVIACGGPTWTREGLRLTTETTVVLLHGYGKAYPWVPGTHIDPSYATEKWGSGNIHTGTVIALFLNELSALLGYT